MLFSLPVHSSSISKFCRANGLPNLYRLNQIMELPRYPIKSDESSMIFEFTSHGPKGSIKKIVKFSETNLKGIFNIAFGDWNGSTGEIDDTSISNNGDSQLVLATVVSTVYTFTDNYPGSWVLRWEVQSREQGFTEWESINIYQKLKVIFIFLG